MGALARVLVYPVLTGGAAVSGWWLFARGLAPPVVLAIVASVGLLAVAALERALPFEQAWLRDQGDTRDDWLHLLISARFLDLGAGAALFGLAWARPALGAGAGLWPSALPLAAQVAAALILSEFSGYWLHRAEHTIPWLWRFHRVHHGATRVYFLNAARNHPVDAWLSGLLSAIPLGLLGAPELVLVVAGSFSVVHAFLQHTNIDLRLGPFNRLFSAAEAHRWHHSTELCEANSNYGQVLLIFDVLFGTWRMPPGRRRPDAIGLAGGDRLPHGYLGHLMSPFRAARTGNDRGEGSGGGAQGLPSSAASTSFTLAPTGGLPPWPKRPKNRSRRSCSA